MKTTTSKLLILASQLAILLRGRSSCSVELLHTWHQRSYLALSTMDRPLTYGQVECFYSRFWMASSHSRVRLMQNCTEESSVGCSSWSEVTYLTTAWTFSKRCSMLIVKQEWLQMSCCKRIGSWLTRARSVAMQRSDVSSKIGYWRSFQSRTSTRIRFVCQLPSRTFRKSSNKSPRLTPLSKSQKNPKSCSKIALQTTETSSKPPHLPACRQASQTTRPAMWSFHPNSKYNRCNFYSKAPRTITQRESKSTKRPCWHTTTQVGARCIRQSRAAPLQAVSSPHT